MAFIDHQGPTPPETVPADAPSPAEMAQMCRELGLVSLSMNGIIVVLADPKPAPRAIVPAAAPKPPLSEEERVLERTNREAAEKSDELRNLLWSSGIDPSALEITERKE